MIASNNVGRVAITGALSFTGRYLATYLLDHALTSSIVNLSSRQIPISSHNLDSKKHLDKIDRHELCFQDPPRLFQALQNVDLLYCTYWIRFGREGNTHEDAARRCKVLFECARDAGVKKVIFTAHTGMSTDSPFPYIAGKDLSCQYLREIASSSDMKYAIVKPCGIFGDVPEESILFNNAAYVLRRTPLFLLPKDGMARFQPIYVKDLVDLLVEVGYDTTPSDTNNNNNNNESPRVSQSTGEELDAVGADAPTAVELFSALRDACGARFCCVVPSRVLSTQMVGKMTKPLDWLTGDVLLDADDLDLMYSGLTVADDPGDERIAKRRGVLEWIHQMGPELGKSYINSVKRYYYPRVDDVPSG